MDKLIRTHDTYPDWHFQPLRLVKSEMANPMGVISDFFSAYHLPGARKHFKEMLEDAMCNVEAYAINYITFYDDVEKLIEAAWLILQQQKEQAVETYKTTGDEKMVAILQLLVAAIRPERIFLLSNSDNKELVDFLIIVPDRDARPFRYYEAIISTVCYTIPDLSFSLHTLSSLQEQLTAGSPFYLFSCTPGKEVYRASDATGLLFPVPDKEKASERWQDYKVTQQKANSFFETAKAAFESGSLTTSIFLLHQAAELCLYGLICTLWGREIKEHSLFILHRHIRRLHIPELDLLLSPATQEERELLKLLDSSYLKSRYTTTFDVSSEQVTHLLKWVLDLLDACNEAGHSLLAHF